MKLIRIVAISCAALTLSACGGEPAAGDPTTTPGGAADTFFYGGMIYTGLDETPNVAAVAVKDGVITASGDRADLESMVGPGTAMIDLRGAAMYPGFTDAHAHLLGIGLRELTLNLEGVGSIDELVDIVAANVADAEPGETVYGRGWIETGWPEGRFPSRQDIDPVSPENPVVLIRADGHAALVNTAAMDKAGLDGFTADPAGGRIEKDAGGQPTGMLIDNAMSLVADLIDAPGPAQKREAYRTAGEVYAAHGWTGLHNMSVDPGDVPLIEEMSDAGEIGVRVYNSVDETGLATLAADGARFSDDGHVVTRAIKLYVDGALGSRGAALLEPYADKPDTSGLSLIEEKDALPILEKAIAAGVQVNTHAIGDRGNRLILDWYEETFSAHPEATDMRWRVEHAQIINPADIPRFAVLGVIPSMQPSHAIGDLFFAPDRLGPERLVGAYAWRSLIDSGAIIPGGSDAPVERGDPLIEFYAAVARKSLDGFSDENWRSEEAVSRAEALKMFTVWPAYASFQEDSLGVIETGKRADFTVFSKDIMTAPLADILKAKPVMTVIDGVIVYQSTTR
jgi:hypothetical protein